MKFFWPFTARWLAAPKPPQIPNTDAELTRMAASLMRDTGCGGIASQVVVAWNARLTSTAGLARPANALVFLNPRLRAFPEEVDRTLRHELAHLVAFVRAHGRRITAHGPEWKKACDDLGIPGESRCHTLPLPRRKVTRRYVYRCPGCAFLLRRTRPIKARRRLACHDCCKQHARGRFDPRFEFVKVQTASLKSKVPSHPASGLRCAESMVQQTLKF